MLSKLLKYINVCKNIGIFNTIMFLWKSKFLNRIFRIINNKTIYRFGKLSIKNYPKPILFRYNSSDISVFWQVFIMNSYKHILKINNPEYIIDCGANVGYTSIYFANMFPNAKIIAIEPDRYNYGLLCINTHIYSKRIKLINSAIWHCREYLDIFPGDNHTNFEWSIHVDTSINKEGFNIMSIDIPYILNKYNIHKIDILKMDIEGAEGRIFSQNHEIWINRVSNFAIELHSNEYQEIFENSINKDNFTLEKYGSTTFAFHK